MKQITRFKLYLYPLVILLAGVALALYVSNLLESDFKNRQRDEFNYQARLQTAALQQKLDLDLGILETLRVYHISHDKIQPKDFSRFVKQLLRQPAEIEGIFWVPRLRHGDIKLLPTLPDSDVQSYNTSSDRNNSAAVVYAIAGHQDDSSVLKWKGTNIYAHPLFRKPLAVISETRWPVSTKPFPLRNHSDKSGIFVLQLVPVKTLLFSSPQNEIYSQGGYVGMLINIPRLVSQALKKFKRRDLNLFLFDQKKRLIASRGRAPKTPSGKLTIADLKQSRKDKGLIHSRLQLYNKEWHIITYPGPDFWLRNYSRGSWIALLSGFVITILTTGLLFSLLKWTRQNEKHAIVDHLTGLFNRRKFFRELDREIDRADRYSHPLSLLLLDLDNFKEINDNHGHPAGDLVLRKLGEIVLNNTRETDLCARYGGEEFAILLPETDAKSALRLARRIKKRFSEVFFETESGEEYSTTCSIGIATRLPDYDQDFSLIDEADRALYRAKEAGKDRIKRAQIN